MLTKRPWVVSAAITLFVAAAAAAIAFFARQPEVASLRSEVAEAQKQAGEYKQNATYQEELAKSLRREINASIGDKLLLTEGTYAALPMTIKDAESQGYKLLDTVIGGKVVEAACFGHEHALHYGRSNPTVTNGVTWHGAPVLLMYSSVNGKIMGVVLESTSPQLSPPWEYHEQGHPGMIFRHWSLHIWFTAPADISPTS
ncbi:MAG: hypothetical protein HYY31_06030 [Chloroflexi bacterium]|nr:hypothetical protein [Chloroflexota bacterium]